VVEKMPAELERCLASGGDTTLMVWADCDHDCAHPDALKAHFWTEAQRQKITRDHFERVVFIFAKDRIENWIQFLATGNTDESIEGPRVKHDREAAEAAKRLAVMCREGRRLEDLPPSLHWSCKSWQTLRNRMQGV
jgi:hypothetical protein